MNLFHNDVEQGLLAFHLSLAIFQLGDVAITPGWDQ